MTSRPNEPFVSFEFLSIDFDDGLIQVRSILDVASPRYLVVTDRSEADEVFVIDSKTANGLLENLQDKLRWTGADLVRELDLRPSIVADLERNALAELMIVGVANEQLFERPLVVSVDDKVRLVIDAMESKDAGEPGPSIEALRIQAADPHADELLVDAVAMNGDLVRLGDGAPGSPPVSPTTKTDDQSPVNGLEVIVPGVVGYDDTVPLVATLTRPGGESPDLEFEAEVGELISIVVWPLEGIVVDGSATATITVAKDAGPADSTTISLRVTSRRRAAVVVEGFRGQTSLGNVMIELQVVVGGAPPAAPAARVIPLRHGKAPRSDLAIHIVEAKDPVFGEGLRFVAIEAGQKPVAFPFQPIAQDPHTYLAPLFDDINEALNSKSAEQPAEVPTADDVVRGIGLTLADQLLPTQLKDFLWEQKARIHSIVVHTDEPAIPWEMCLLTHTTKSGDHEEVGYLCELFELTRWRPSLSAREELTMRSIGVIAPRDSGLKSRTDEVAMLEALRNPDRSVNSIDATTRDVLDALEGATYDVIHFIGHGELPDSTRPTSARLVLAGASYLQAEWLGGAVANFGKTQPLVFLNACRLGSASAGLVGPAGWARAVLDAGSAAFVGAHWDVVDVHAHEFAAELYKCLDAGEPIGKAAKKARLATRQPGDPTWLAYTVFASPSATLARPMTDSA